MAIKKQTTSKVEKLTCDKCGKLKPITQYYGSDRDEYVEYGGYVPTCKSCFTLSVIDENLNKVTTEKIKPVLKKIDIPFIESVFIEIANNPKTINNNFLGNYKSLLNLKPKYKHLKYSDTVDIEIEQEKIKNMRVDIKQEKLVNDDMIMFWGRGLSDDEYLDLQNRFDRFMENETDEIDYKKESDYKSLCIYELQKAKIQFDITKIKETQTLQRMIDDLSTNLGIKAIQKKEDKNNNRHYIIGLTAKYIEDVKREPILLPSDYMKNYNKSEFEKELRLCFAQPLLDSFEMVNPFKDEWEEEKKQYEPTEDELIEAIDILVEGEDYGTQ